MRLNIEAIRNPILSFADKSVRDPVIHYENDFFYLFYTAETGREKDIYSYHIEMITTKDLVRFSRHQVITPFGFAAPSNLLKFGNQWYLFCCSYPYEQDNKSPARLYYLKSKDLINWSQPICYGNGLPNNRWHRDSRMIDGTVIKYDNYYYLAYKNSNILGFARSLDLEIWEDLCPENSFVILPQENVQYTEIDRKHFMVTTVFKDTTSCGKRTAYYTTTDFRNYKYQGLFEIPEQRFSAQDRDMGFLADLRHICGKFILVFGGSEAGDSAYYPKAFVYGHARLGIAFSDDLKQWCVPDEKPKPWEK